MLELPNSQITPNLMKIHLNIAAVIDLNASGTT
jgi:hypothetical protein